MPKRERNGADNRPVRVVAPTSEKRGSLISGSISAFGPVADGDLEPEVLHRRIEVLLDDGLQAVDLVDEEDAALLSDVRYDGERAFVLDGRRADRA